MENKSNEAIYMLILLSMCFLFFGCSVARENNSNYDAEILNNAVSAIGDENAKCVATDYSTDDEKLLNTIKTRDFSIVEKNEFVRSGNVVSKFVLRSRNSNFLIDAIIRNDNAGNCIDYTFVRIAE